MTLRVNVTAISNSHYEFESMLHDFHRLMVTVNRRVVTDEIYSFYHIRSIELDSFS